MAPGGTSSKSNVLPLWGNEKTMNLNSLILTNIQSSHYFKVNLFELKTYHEVIDEIYYKVAHLEPWEKGSRKTSGQTGMCGGVRGVGAGGIVSTAFCLLYKLFTLKLTRKQVNGLLTHSDSPYIRALGFMYVRYTQPPADLWDWYEDYLDDDEEVDVKAGGGGVMAVGEMLRHFLTKLEWYSTLFPRIPVPIQKDLERKLTNHGPLLHAGGVAAATAAAAAAAGADNLSRPGDGPGSGDYDDCDDEADEISYGEAERVARLGRSGSAERHVASSREEQQHGGGGGGYDRRNGERKERDRRGEDRDRCGRRDHHYDGDGRRHKDRREHRHHHGGDERRSRDDKHRDQERSRSGDRQKHSREHDRNSKDERYQRNRHQRSRSKDRHRQK